MPEQFALESLVMGVLIEMVQSNQPAFFFFSFSWTISITFSFQSWFLKVQWKLKLPMNLQVLIFAMGSHRVWQDWATNTLCISKLMAGEGNGNPLQYSCLENPVDEEAWYAIVHGVPKSWTRLHFHFQTDGFILPFYNPLIWL